MPQFRLKSKSNWNSSKKKKKSSRQQQPRPTQNKSKKSRSKNAGFDAGIVAMKSLNSSQHKPNEQSKSNRFNQSRRQAKISRKQTLRRKSLNRYMTKEALEAPKSFIVTRGKVTQNCQNLRDDLRVMFSPYTAAKLKERKNASLQDYIHASPDFGVTHLITLSQSDIAGTMLRMIRLPKGPTFWFRVAEYSLIGDILSVQRKEVHYKYSLSFPALIILNGFSQQVSKMDNDNSNDNSESETETDMVNIPNSTHRNLMAAMFKHMFPPMNIATMKLNHCKRVIFFNYNIKDHSIDIRHYKIKLANVGISRPLKKLIRDPIPTDNKYFQNKNLNKYTYKYKKQMRKRKNKDKIPDLSKFNDISDYVERKNDNNGSGAGAGGDYGYHSDTSDSEVEDTDATRIILPQTIHNEKGKAKGYIDGQSAVRLREIGPRIKLELIKIEELVNDGRVLYHRLISKTAQQVQELEFKKQREIELKKQRIAIQNENVKRKEQKAKQAKFKKKEQRKEKQISQLLEKFGSNNNENNNENKTKNANKKGILKQKRNLENNNNDNTNDDLNDFTNDEPPKKRTKFSTRKKSQSKRGVRFNV